MNLTNGSNSSDDTEIVILHSTPNPNLPYFGNVVFTIVALLLIFLALSSNLFIIVNLLKKSSIGVSHHLIINLCLTDIIKCLLFFVTFNISTFFGSWKLGTLFCKILPSLHKGGQQFSVYILGILARQRYIAIVKPFKQSEKLYRVYIEIFCSCLGSYVPSVVTTQSSYRIYATTCVFFYEPNEHEDLDGFRTGLLIGYLAPFVIPHSLFVFYYLMIKRAFRKNSENLGDNNAAVSQRNQRNKKATRTILASVLTYDFVLLPAVTLYSLATIYPNELSALRECGELLQLVYSCINPALFIWRNNELKNALKRLIGKEPRRI